MIAPRPATNAARRARHERRLQACARPLSCARCGETDPAALVAVSRSRVDIDHVAGRAVDADLTVPLCRNCHAHATEARRSAGVPMRFPPPGPSELDRLGNVLCGFGLLAGEVAFWLASWAAGNGGPWAPLIAALAVLVLAPLGQFLVGLARSLPTPEVSS